MVFWKNTEFDSIGEWRMERIEIEVKLEKIEIIEKTRKE